jgi:hypothetical protein
VCVLRATGQVFCWGRGEAGAHGDGENQLDRPALTTPVLLDPELPPVVAISGHLRSYCALHEDGKVRHDRRGLRARARGALGRAPRLAAGPAADPMTFPNELS